MKYSEQQTGLSSTLEAQTENSTLALLFFAMGALHIYAMMRSRSRKTLLAGKANIRSSPGTNLYLTVGLVAVAMALVMQNLIFY
ncbi:MAG: hypothetical protein QNJ72_34090 [Pleurocapsa sp. MO_226.B13]|nr:hypothetical protein [Pleurocapsa sp. MO_226.B13]